MSNLRSAGVGDGATLAVGGLRRLTVARLRKTAAGTQAMFLEAARIYLVPADHARHDALLQRLVDSRDVGRAVLVRVTEDHGDVIDDVRD